MNKSRSLKKIAAFAGINKIVWDGRNNTGTLVPGGIYFVRLYQDGLIRTRKITVVR